MQKAMGLIPRPPPVIIMIIAAIIIKVQMDGRKQDWPQYQALVTHTCNPSYLGG
jgi:hypothetical protein